MDHANDTARAGALLDTPPCAPLFSGKGAADGTAVLVTGAPGSGKTALALAAAERAMDAFGADRVVLTASNRLLADDLSPELIRHVGVTGQARPATTPNALAFRLVTAQRARAGQPLPRLLNGAEQDALLRRILAGHLEEVRAGNPCRTCLLLRDYFANEEWMRTVCDTYDEATPEQGPAARTTEDLFAAGINPAFTAQLRDMLARMDEADVTAEGIRRAGDAVAGRGIAGERLRIQWGLAAALRTDYIDAIARAYPGEYRLDSSYLQVAGAHAASSADPADLPRFVAVDDFQDLTLAGLSFLMALRARGTRLLLVGNPDESVQSFRGSHPDYLFERAAAPTAQGGMGAALLTLDAHPAPAPTYLDTLASRVSLSIGADRPTDTALPRRAGKLPALPGAYPVQPLVDDDARLADGSLETLLYRSPQDELDAVLWQVRSRYLQGRDGQDGQDRTDGPQVRWNDMAIVLHDNDQIRRFGETLREAGIPVRYSSVTKPLAQEPFVQALFALIELAMLRNDGLDRRTMTLRQAAGFVRSRVAAAMRSPLLDRPGGSSRRADAAQGDPDGHPVALEQVDAALRALQALATVADTPRQEAAAGDAAAGDDADGPDTDPTATQVGLLAGMAADWGTLRARVADAHARTAEARGIEIVDDGDTLGFGIDALYLMLAQDGAPAVLDTVARICGEPDDGPARTNRPAGRFLHLWRTVATLAAQLRTLRAPDPQFALEAAWMACDVAKAWQRDALFDTPAGRAANDRLDTAVRLFEYARTDGVAPGIAEFIDQVRALQIQADSLARLAPVDDAVTVTTPAGAAGHHWQYVWMPGLQEDTWPNLAERNTLFGGEELVDLLLDGPGTPGSRDAGHDQARRTVLATEQKSFLVAVTRAGTHLTLSATMNDDTVPSSFLYAYLPERYDRSGRATQAVRPSGPPVGGALPGSQGLDADPRGLATLARIALTATQGSTPQREDAAQALAVLAARGIDAAQPDHWAFLTPTADGTQAAGAPAPTARAARPAGGTGTTAARHAAALAAQPPAGERAPRYADPFAHAPVVTLSPSKVDRLWSCPVCARMEQQFFGPVPAKVALDYGTIIHDVARIATEQGWDAAGFAAHLPRDERVDTVAGLMQGAYRELRRDPDTIEDPAARYDAMDRDAQTDDTLRNIAAYYVDSTLTGDDAREYYDLGGKAAFQVGALTDSRAEVEFTARFGPADILDAYNAIDGIDPVGMDDLMGIMGALVGGWPSSMRPDLQVRLVGRMDRQERRVLADGTTVTRLIDYKTGKQHTLKEHYNDLQLVCYQLALAFPEGSGLHGARAVQAMPPVSQSELFDVAQATRPASRTSKQTEPYFQDALFANGSVNAGAFQARQGVPGQAKLLDFDLPDACPAGVDPHAWEQFTGLRGTLAVWAVAMIARVFYTAAASIAPQVVAHPSKEHAGQCRMKELCPACNGRASTVFETREG